MGEGLLSVGLDVGTTTTQMVVSRLDVENRGSAFSVPEMVISGREVIYRSPVYFTPLRGKDRVDGEKIRGIVAAEYEKAGIVRENVDTGAIIITGETSRKENARAVLEALAGFAGDFVVATAGPDLESALAARGAGAVEYSARTGKRVLHMDIGGGTSNLAWIADGKIVATGCLNVGGRLLKFDEDGALTYVSPALDGLTELKVGDHPPERQVEQTAQLLAEALEMAAGLRQPTQLLEKLWTEESASGPQETAAPVWGQECGAGEVVLSFSGGVADCIEKKHFWREFGDMGPILGQKIRESRLCAGEYRLGSETIRATVIGAGSHSLQLSGSTVFYRDVQFPLKNLPVVPEGTPLPADENAVLYLPGEVSPGYSRVVELAERITALFGGRPILVAMGADMAKALGQAIALRSDGPVLCMDGLTLREGDYLDVGAPVGPALPVVVKTLILER